jgi:hypothetical protein
MTVCNLWQPLLHIYTHTQMQHPLNANNDDSCSCQLPLLCVENCMHQSHINQQPGIVVHPMLEGKHKTYDVVQSDNCQLPSLPPCMHSCRSYSGLTLLGRWLMVMKAVPNAGFCAGPCVRFCKAEGGERAGGGSGCGNTQGSVWC